MNRHTITPPRLGRALTVAAVFGTVALTAGSAHAGVPIPPDYTIDYRCEEDGAYIEIETIDETTLRYDVYLDDVLVVDFESDPDGTPWEFGPYADGSSVFVEIYWYTSPEDEVSFLLADGTVNFECSPDDTGVPTTDSVATTASTATTGAGGSGGTLPATGGSDTTLVVTALAMLAAGGALLATRRRPRNA